MAKFTDVNNIGNSYNGCDAMFAFKECLKAAGWSVIGSGDGSSWSQGGIDYITSAAVLRTNRAWFRLQDPSGTKATGILTLGAAPLNNETVTIGTKVYTFKTTLSPAEGEVLIEASASASIDNLVAAITHGAGLGTKYQCAAAHPSVTAAAGALDTMDATAIARGTQGNSIATTETLTDVGSSWANATLLGGLDGRREFVIQRVTYDYAFRVKYSALDRFIGGSPSATQVPSATDEKVNFGSGTDASPTGGNWFSSITDTFYYHVIAYSDAISGVYAFYSFTTDTGTGTSWHGFFCEPLAAGSFPSADVDPCIVHAYTSNSGVWGIGTMQSYGAYAWYKMNLTGETWVQMYPYNYVAGYYILVPNQAGLNHYDGDDNGLPILWGRDTSIGTQIGHKGFGARLRMRTTDKKTYPCVVDLDTDAKVYFGDLLVPWEDNTMPAL